jgi:DNA-binding LytR/AlgR family response regulator
VITDPVDLLRVLVVDDEAPARDELSFLLAEDSRVGTVRSAPSAAVALKLLSDEPVDAIFCDIKMPGLDGMELARIVSRFAARPKIVFVTAYDDHAVDAFELQATDYVMKPVRASRVAEAVRRVVTSGAGGEPGEDETIPVDLAGVTRFVRRSQVRFVEAHGDYARLHTAGQSHLVRTPLSVLEERWGGDVGFVRIHRSTLVALSHIDEVRTVDGRMTVVLGRDELPVSRRHTRELRDRLGASRHESAG